MIPAKDLARTLDLSEAYLVGLCEQGRLPAQKIEGTWVVWEDNLDAAREQAQRRLPAMDDDPF